MNHKRLFRLYREEKLGVRKRKGRKRALGVRAPIPAAQGINDRWSLDFVHDQLTDGRRFRILTVVDDATRECLALVADTSISGARVARELNRIVAMRRCSRRGSASLSIAAEASLIGALKTQARSAGSARKMTAQKRLAAA